MLNFLVPPFIRKIDKYFLLNHPILWISKIHYVCYFAILMWGFSALIGVAMPLNLAAPQDMAVWYVVFTILALILFCVWIYKNTIFNIEKKFGHRHWADEFKLFFLYFLTIFIFFSFAYPFTVVYQQRIAHSVSDEALIQDINILNRADALIPTSAYEYYNYTDSITQKTYYDFNRRQSFGSKTPYIISEDTLQFRTLHSYFQLREQYLTDKESGQRIVEAYAGHNQVLQKYGLRPDIDPDQMLRKYKALCAGWQTDSTHSLIIGSYSGYSDLNEYSIDRIVENIAEAKFRPIFLLRTDFLFFVFYFTLYVCTFFLLFRSVQWQHFLIMIVALAVLPILLFIVGQILPYYIFHSRGALFEFGVILVFITSCVCVIRSMIYEKKFSVFVNIGMQFFYILIAVMPMYIIEFLDNNTDLFHNSYREENYNYYADATTMMVTTESTPYPAEYYLSKEYYFNQLLNEYYRDQHALWFLGMQIAGVAFFIFIVVPGLKSLFVKQLALPRKK